MKSILHKNNWVPVRLIACFAATVFSTCLFYMPDANDLFGSGLVLFVCWVAIMRFAIWEAIAIVSGVLFNEGSGQKLPVRAILLSDLLFVVATISFSFCMRYWVMPDLLPGFELYGQDNQPLFKDGALTELGLHKAIRQMSWSLVSTIVSWAISTLVLIHRLGQQNSDDLRAR
jgi:hypothetical protein